MSDDKNKLPVLVLIPVFNDWQSLSVLLQFLDQNFTDTNIQAEVIVVDDASTKPIPNSFLSDNYSNLNKVSILGLRRNLGHQRAITVGLAYIEENFVCKAVVVMDGDGEDDPKDVLRLIEKCSAEKLKKIVFAQRTQQVYNPLNLNYLLRATASFFRLDNQFNIGHYSKKLKAIQPLKCRPI